MLDTPEGNSAQCKTETRMMLSGSLQRLRIMMMCAIPCMGKNMYKGHGDFYTCDRNVSIVSGDGFELDKNPVLNKSGLRMEPDGR